MPNSETETTAALEATEPLEGEQPAVPAAPAPAAPDYDARIAAMEQQQQQTLRMIQEGFTMLASSQREAAASREPATPELTDAQVEAEIAEGRGAQAIRQMVEARTARAIAAIKRDAIDPLATLVQGTGLESIALLARRQAELDVHETLKPYVARHRQEIDAAISGMAPELRLKAEHIALAQGVILTRHLPEILEEERQKVIRQFRDNPASVPGAAHGRQARDTGPAVATADDLFGRNSPEARMIRQAGGEDAFIAKHARGPGASQTWAEYVDRYQQMQGQGEGTA